MNRKKTVSFAAGTAICIIIALCIFVNINSNHDYDKTVVINNAVDAEALKKANLDAVADVRLQRLPVDIPDHGMFGIWGWHDGKLLAEYQQPYFTLDSSGKIVGLKDPQYRALDYDYNKNALYLIDSQNGKSEILQKTGPYNQIWGQMSPDREKVLLLEAYRKTNGTEALDDAQGIKDRVRIYDFKTGQFTLIDEIANEDGKNESVSILGIANWSLDGRGVVLCHKTASDKYIFTIYDSKSGGKTNFEMEDKQERFDFIRVIAVSKDYKKVWFRGVKGTENRYLNGYIDQSTEAALYEMDLNNPGKEAQKLLDNVYNCRILSDEDSVIYLGNPSASFESNLYMYSITKKQSRLIAEHAMPYTYDVSKDEKRLAYISPYLGEGYNINMLRLDSDTVPESTLLYKSGPSVTLSSPLYWNGDGSQLATSFFSGDNSKESPVQLCVLTIKKDK